MSGHEPLNTLLEYGETIDKILVILSRNENSCTKSQVAKVGLLSRTVNIFNPSKKCVKQHTQGHKHQGAHRRLPQVINRAHRCMLAQASRLLVHKCKVGPISQPLKSQHGHNICKQPRTCPSHPSHRVHKHRRRNQHSSCTRRRRDHHRNLVRQPPRRQRCQPGRRMRKGIKK